MGSVFRQSHRHKMYLRVFIITIMMGVCFAGSDNLGFLDDVPSTIQVYRRSFLDDVPSRVSMYRKRTPFDPSEVYDEAAARTLELSRKWYCSGFEDSKKCDQLLQTLFDIEKNPNLSTGNY